MHIALSPLFSAVRLIKQNDQKRQNY